MSFSKDHVIDRSQPVEVQLEQAEAWLDQMHSSFVEVQKTCGRKDEFLLKTQEENNRLKAKIAEMHRKLNASGFLTFEAPPCVIPPEEITSERQPQNPPSQSPA